MYENVDVWCSPSDARALVTRYLWIPPERAMGTASRQESWPLFENNTQIKKKELTISNPDLGFL